MNELFPILSGATLGAALVLVAPRLRLRIAITASLVFGAIATIISGEYRIGWEFLLVDIPLVAASSVAGFLGVGAARGNRILRRKDT